MRSVCLCVCTSYIYGRVIIEVKNLAFLGMLATPAATTRNYLNITQHSACAKHRLYHTQAPKAFRANTFGPRDASLSLSRSGLHSGNGQTGQQNQGTYYTSSSSVGTLKQARKLVPLDLASMPKEARYNKKFPLTNPMLSSRRAPATNEARETPPGPAASSHHDCKNFIAGWP
jgi:hypothetical protein